MKILLTGSVGFIGFHLAKKLLDNNHKVTGIDNLCKSYGVKYKKQRLDILKKYKNFKFYKKDIKNINLIKEKKIDFIIHLAAQAGVRLSQNNPEIFINDNILATVKLFEFAKIKKIKNIFYASSSSVYGNCNKYPSYEKLNVNKPLSIYGITKSCNEDLAYYYNFVYGINSIGFRFFTVYGPLGRPDMSIGIFFSKILKGEKIDLFNKGENYRDYTYIDDIVNQIYVCFKKVKKKKSYNKVFNIGGEKTIKIKELLKLIEKITNKKAKIKLMKKNKLDPVKSLANNNEIQKFTKFKKTTTIKAGLTKVYNSLVDQINI
jgi:UDP-glucuronate 4-epimerase